MCGRFTLTENWTDILRYYGISRSDFAQPPRYNIAPSDDVVSVISDRKERRIGPLSWGLIPQDLAFDPKDRISVIQVEGLETNTTFRKLVERKRCLIVADGYYEWARNTRRPHRVRLRSRNLFSFAGVWNIWETAVGDRVSTCAIITCKANMCTRVLQDRMPVILRDFQDERFWLDKRVMDSSELFAVLKPYPADDMYVYPVSQAIENLNNDSVELIREVSLKAERRC